MGARVELKCHRELIDNCNLSAEKSPCHPPTRSKKFVNERSAPSNITLRRGKAISSHDKVPSIKTNEINEKKREASGSPIYIIVLRFLSASPSPHPPKGFFLPLLIHFHPLFESIFGKCLMECDRNAILTLNSTANMNRVSTL
jgi:hypothetical protein